MVLKKKRGGGGGSQGNYTLETFTEKKEEEMKNYKVEYKLDFINRVQSGPITPMSLKLRDQMQSNARNKKSTFF